MKMLCKVTRGKNIESQHIIYAIALDEGGKTVFNTGPKDYTTYARSSLKPFQASAIILEELQNQPDLLIKILHPCAHPTMEKKFM